MQWYSHHHTQLLQSIMKSDIGLTSPRNHRAHRDCPSPTHCETLSWRTNLLQSTESPLQLCSFHSVCFETPMASRLGGRIFARAVRPSVRSAARTTGRRGMSSSGHTAKSSDTPWIVSVLCVNDLRGPNLHCCRLALRSCLVLRYARGMPREYKTVLKLLPVTPRLSGCSCPSQTRRRTT